MSTVFVCASTHLKVLPYLLTVKYGVLKSVIISFVTAETHRSQLYMAINNCTVDTMLYLPLNGRIFFVKTYTLLDSPIRN